MNKARLIERVARDTGELAKADALPGDRRPAGQLHEVPAQGREGHPRVEIGSLTARRRRPQRPQSANRKPHQDRGAPSAQVHPGQGPEEQGELAATRTTTPLGRREVATSREWDRPWSWRATSSSRVRPLCSSRFDPPVCRRDRCPVR